jgi:hypothetical protein
MKTIRFLNEDCRLVRDTYKANDGVALLLVCEDGSPMATATVCLPEYQLEVGEIVIKDYGENAGMLDALVKAGVVSDTGRTVQTGWVHSPICKLL